MNFPKISIIVVTLNAASVLEATLESALQQTYPNKEIVVVDGVSKDATWDIVLSKKDQLGPLLQESDKGLYDAMNKGIKLALGEYVFFLNAGDVFKDAKALSRVVEAVTGFDDVIYTDVEVAYGSGQVKHRPAGNLSKMWQGMPFCHQASLTKRDLHEQFPFDLSYKLGADYDFFLRVMKAGAKFHYVPVVLCQVSAGGLSDKLRFLALDEWQRAWMQHVGPYTLFQSLYRLGFKCRTYLALSVKKILSFLG